METSVGQKENMLFKSVEKSSYCSHELETFSFVLFHEVQIFKFVFIFFLPRSKNDAKSVIYDKLFKSVSLLQFILKNDIHNHYKMAVL
jgi:hypothetical protein